MLENRPDLFEIGREAIAWALIPHENLKHLFEVGDWYQYLLRAIKANSFEGVANNILTIITFNYDRSLETYLLMALQKMYKGVARDAAVDILNQIPIIHLHGQLGMLGWQTENHDGRPYEGRMSPEIIKESANGIRIVHEAEAMSREFEQARRAIAEAKRVFFLGFGYDEANLSRLKITWTRKKDFAGSCYGLRPAEIGW